MHPAEELWSRHHPPQGYPTGVIGVPEPIPGIAFFPGGYGLWREDLTQPLPTFPVGGVMVLGHDFHSKTGYEASLARGREAASQPTWRNLTVLLERAGIPFTRCFFTNVYMGLRDDGSTTGPFPGAKDPVFVAHCVAFLREQLAAQRPSLILTLGINAPAILGTQSADLAAWTRRRGLKHLDENSPVRQGVSFQGLPGLATTVVALTHPSQRAASVRHRRYGGEDGAAAELAMLRDGLAICGPSIDTTRKKGYAHD
jgi:hypothetical protein